MSACMAQHAAAVKRTPRLSVDAVSIQLALRHATCTNWQIAWINGMLPDGVPAGQGIAALERLTDLCHCLGGRTCWCATALCTRPLSACSQSPHLLILMPLIGLLLMVQAA